MRITSILRASTLALLLAVAAVGSVGTAFADQVASQSQSQAQQTTGPYDGADYQAAKNAFY